MVGELIMLPLRIGVRATRLWLRVAEETATVAANATGRLIELAASRGSDERGGNSTPTSAPERNGARQTDSRDHDAPDASASNRDASVSAEQALTQATPRVAQTRPLDGLGETEPVHVSEEPTLVEELAEPGAEDGAGAEVHVEEPWDGYAQMNAKRVVDRLRGARPAELAAVQLYESSHRRRQTILNAIERERRGANGRGSRNQ
jgi:hypothetical protein